MDYDLPLLLSPLQNDKEWKNVEVSGSLISNPGIYNLTANGLFIFLSTSTQNSNILFIPNYIPILDPNNKKPVVYLQSILIQKIRHTFIFSELNQVMNFVNYIYKSNAATDNFIKNVDIYDYLVGDQISGIIPKTNQKISQLMVISQIKQWNIVFQAHIVNKDGVVPGLTFSFSRNSFVSPIYEVPKILKKEKDILTRSFTLFSTDNPKEASYFIAKNESEMARFVMALHVSIIYSSNQRRRSITKLSSANGSEQNLNATYAEINLINNNDEDEKKVLRHRDTFIKKVLDDPSSFYEILDKTILTDQVKPVSIKQIQQVEPISYSKEINYNSLLSKPPSDEKIANLKIEIPSNYNEDMDFNVNLINQDQNIINDDYNHFKFEHLPQNSSAFSLIDKIGYNNNDLMKDIKLIEEALNIGIKEKGQQQSSGAWKVFCDISETNKNKKINDEFENFVRIINQLQNPDASNELRKCQTPLQDLIRIGIEMKILHLWILLTTSYKDIVQKYFNPESTLADSELINYCAFAIYNFIK